MRSAEDGKAKRTISSEAAPAKERGHGTFRWENKKMRDSTPLKHCGMNRKLRS
jgi:hypothetical protein